MLNESVQGKEIISIFLWIGLIGIILILTWEVFLPSSLRESFENEIGTSVGDSKYWARWFPKRGDVGPANDEEDGGYIRLTRYFHDFADVQRLGVKHDFCRMLQRKDQKDDIFFACALAGTEGLSTQTYKTNNKNQGFEISRDDYMRDILGEGRDGYCRILKNKDGTFEAKCNPAGDEKFQNRLVTDTNPPSEIADLLDFYEGIMVWLRLRDDMEDYAKNVRVSKAGNIFIEENPPNPPETDGLIFNGIDQYLRISDSDNLSLGDIVQMRFLRAVSFWVYFDEFSNNAHIFDFGNGAGQDNVWLGIMGRGDSNTAGSSVIRPLLCSNSNTSVIPENPSGPQEVPEISPIELMLGSQSNVDEYECPKPEIFGKKMKPLSNESIPSNKLADNATLVYEVWDMKQRKMHIQIPGFFPIKKWTHVVITAKSNDAFRPDIQIWKNGILVHEEESGHLPQASSLAKNYIGKSNWVNTTSQMENADQLFCGKIFDFRLYNTMMSEEKIQKTIKWGLGKLHGEEKMAKINKVAQKCKNDIVKRVKRDDIINRPPSSNNVDIS